MPRYNDTDKLIEEIKERIKAAIEWGKSAETEEIKIRAEQAVATFCEASLTAKKLSTADVVEVVRCKDCKYRHKEWYQDKRNKDGGYWIIGCGNDAIAERVYGLAQDNDFCSYGERKEE